MGYLKYPEVYVCVDMTISFLAGKIIERNLKLETHKNIRTEGLVIFISFGTLLGDGRKNRRVAFESKVV